MHPTYQNRRHEVDPENIFYYDQIPNINLRYSPGYCTSACRMHHHENCHAIIHVCRSGRVIWKLSESNFYEDIISRDGPPKTTLTSGNEQYSCNQNSLHNGKAKKNSSKWHELLLDQIQNPTKPYIYNLGRKKEKLAYYVTIHHSIWHHR